MAATAVLAVAALAGLGWFNWWVRHTWRPIHPVCWDGEEYVQLSEPLTPEAHALFLRYMARTRVEDTEQRRKERATYVRVMGSQAYVRTWYWLLGGVEMNNLQGYLERDLEKMFNVKEGSAATCLGLARTATIRRSDFYATKPYISDSLSETIEPLTFGVFQERNGTYTWIGRFFQRFEDVPP